MMKYVKAFDTDAIGNVERRKLDQVGIKSCLVVDPLESIYPALSTLSAVVVAVEDDNQWDQACEILKAS